MRVNFYGQTDSLISRATYTTLPFIPSPQGKGCVNIFSFRRRERFNYSLFIKTAAFLICLSFLSGCGNKGFDSNTTRPPVAVEVMETAVTDVADELSVTGTLTPKAETEIKSQVPGIVKAVYVSEWVHVKKGTLLAKIDSGETEAMNKRAEAAVESAKAALLQAEVAVRKAEREKTRIRGLREYGLATEQATDDSETETAAAAARTEAARAQVRAAEEDVRQIRARLAKSDIRAPIDGVVSYVDVHAGDLASDTGAAKPLFKIVDNRILDLTVSVPSSEMSGLRPGIPVDFTVDAFPGRTFTARIKYVNPSVNEADRTVGVTAEYSNTSGELKGGLFAKGKIGKGTRKDLLLVPRQALIGFDAAQKKAAVFVVEGENARQRQITTGEVYEDKVEIVSGLKAGERLVVRGGFNLKDGMRVSTGKRQEG